MTAALRRMDEGPAPLLDPVERAFQFARAAEEAGWAVNFAFEKGDEGERLTLSLSRPSGRE